MQKALINTMAILSVTAVMAAIFVPPIMAEWNRFNAVFTCLGKDCQVIELNEQFLTGTDGACEAAGEWLLSQFKANPNLKRIVIANQGWVPSIYRIIDRQWAECLADPDLIEPCEGYDPGFEFNERLED